MSNEVDPQLEPLINSLFEIYKEKIGGTDKEDFQEYIVQGEYELAISNLLASIKKVGIELSSDDVKKVDSIYKMMEIPNPNNKDQDK